MLIIFWPEIAQMRGVLLFPRGCLLRHCRYWHQQANKKSCHGTTQSSPHIDDESSLSLMDFFLPFSLSRNIRELMKKNVTGIVFHRKKGKSQKETKTCYINK